MAIPKTTSQMMPFHSDPLLQGWDGHLPTPEEVAKLNKRLAIEKFVRLWLTEGTPYAFKNCPAIYEDIRGWLAYRLDACPKDITIVGSARLGFSLKPEPNFGRSFGERSDLDFALISVTIFEEFRKMFFLWVNDYEKEVVKPQNETEGGYWIENKEFGRRNLPLGFFDANKLPNLDRYRVVQRVNSTMWRLKKRIEVTPGAPVIRKASVRIYRDWKSLVTRVSYNLMLVLSKLAATSVVRPNC